MQVVVERDDREDGARDASPVYQRPSLLAAATKVANHHAIDQATKAIERFEVANALKIKKSNHFTSDPSVKVHLKADSAACPAQFFKHETVLWFIIHGVMQCTQPPPTEGVTETTRTRVITATRDEATARAKRWHDLFDSRGWTVMITASYCITCLAGCAVVASGRQLLNLSDATVQALCVAQFVCCMPLYFTLAAILNVGMLRQVSRAFEFWFLALYNLTMCGGLTLFAGGSLRSLTWWGCVFDGVLLATMVDCIPPQFFPRIRVSVPVRP
jgi:hypothetical protein